MSPYIMLYIPECRDYILPNIVGKNEEWKNVVKGVSKYFSDN